MGRDLTISYFLKVMKRFIVNCRVLLRLTSTMEFSKLYRLPAIHLRSGQDFRNALK